VQVQGHQRVAGALHLADQLVDLVAVQQQLAGAGGVGADVGRGGFERRDVHPEDVELPVADDHVAFLDIAPPGPDALHFPAGQNDAGLVAFFDEVVVKGLAVVDDAHWRRLERTRKIAHFNS
jgi:hypothetical protein